MAKWKAPVDAGPGVSVGGQFFPIVDGHVTTPSGDYSDALTPFGYIQVDDADDAAPAPQAAAPEPVAPAVEPVTAAEPETPPSDAPAATEPKE